MQRIYFFLPTISIITGIWVLLSTYIALFLAFCIPRRNITEWTVSNKSRVFWLLCVPWCCFYASLLEEMIFRAPLVILFVRPSLGFWGVAVILNLLFSLCHWFLYKNPLQFCLTLLWGPIASFVGVVYQSLWLPILIHAAYNLIILALVVLILRKHTIQDIYKHLTGQRIISDSLRM